MGHVQLFSVLVSVSLSANALTAERSILGARLCRVQQRAIIEKSLPVYGVCLCNQGAYTDISVDAVDRLLINLKIRLLCGISDTA